MKRLIFLAMMTVCSVSWAEWELCGSSGVDDKKAMFFCETSTIRRNGEISRMWEITTYTKVQTNARGDRYMSFKALKAYNCRDFTQAAISFVLYSEMSGEGNAVLSNTRQESELEWIPIPPGTTGETLWKFACGKK